MPIDELEEASEILRGAVEDTDDETIRERLEKQADQLAALSTRDRGPDHGRVARHQGALRDIQDDAGDVVGDAVSETNDLLNAYRETVEGV